MGEQQREAARAAQTEAAKQLPEMFRASVVSESILHELQTDAGTPEEKKAHLLAILHQRGATLFEGKEEVFEQFLERVAEMSFEDEALVADNIGQALEQVFLTYMNPDDIRAAAWRREKMIRVQQNLRTDRHVLSPEGVLTYDQSGSTVHLHISDAKTLGLGEKINEFRVGMQTLAKELQTNPALAGVDTISATSWIVAANPRMLELAGFTLDPAPLDAETLNRFVGETRPVARATMTREKLIERFGK